MSLLRYGCTADDSPRATATGDVILAIEAGASALRARAQKLADDPDADEQAQGIIESWFEEASLLDALAAELRQ